MLGQSWSVAEAISNPTQNSVCPKIAVDLNGNAMAIWYRFTLTNSVYSNVTVQASYQPVNSTWTSPVDISSQGVRNPADLVARVAFDGNGNAIALWNNSFDYSIFNIETAIYSNSMWTSLQALAGDYYSYYEDLAVDASGNAFAVDMLFAAPELSLAIEVTNSNIAAYYKNYWSVPDVLSTGRMNGYPRIAALSSGDTVYAAAVWINFDSKYSVIQATTGMGTLLAPPTNLTITQTLNTFGTGSEYINIVRWNASPDPSVSGYLLFRDGILI